MKNWAEEYENIGHSHEIFTQNLDRTVTNVVQLLMLKAMTISTAESCTGGLLSELITSVPGASQVFELGVCTYSNRIKQTLLNVPEGMLAQYGSVSRQVALAMVRGLKEKSGADLCISVTGLAGPGGGTPEQPVGTVYVGFAFGSTEWVSGLRLWELDAINRNSIRRHTALCAFGIAEHILAEVGNQ